MRCISMSKHILIKGKTATDDAEYDLHLIVGKKGTTYVLTYLNKMRKDWSPELEGQEVMSILDHGDGFDLRIDQKVMKLDYSQIQELLALIQVINKDTNQHHEVFEVEYQELKL